MVVLIMVAVLAQAAMLIGSARAQDSPVSSDAAAKPSVTPDAPAQEPEPASAEALSVRYRFSERYSTTEAPDHPERITQYRVGVHETQKNEREKQQGAPDRSQIEWRTIYTERAAQVNKLGGLTSVVRRYDRFQVKETATARSPKIPPFEGLSIWYQLQPGQKPLVLNLTNDHPLRELEYSRITHQVFVPRLAGFFPPGPRRVRDSWPISLKVAQSLVGEMPDADDFEMTATLLEVRRSRAGDTLTAIIDIAGQLNLSFGTSALSAQIHFVFKPAAAVLPSSDSRGTVGAGDNPAGRGVRRGEEGIVEARGSITRVLMAWRATNILPEEEGRLKLTRTYELNLERQLSPPSKEATPGGPNAPLVIPETIPTPTEANSSVLYDDGRLHFRHPEELEIDSNDGNMLTLVEKHPKGDMVINISLLPKETDPVRDRQRRDPDYHRRNLYSNWQKAKRDVIPGSTGWLPDAEWAPLKRRVYRIEAALVPKEEGPNNTDRLYLDFYLVLFNTNETVVVTAFTEQDSNLKLRDKAEAIIKSFNFGPSDGQGKARVANPAPPLSPPN
jgi:hypothetical protein